MTWKPLTWMDNLLPYLHANNTWCIYATMGRCTNFRDWGG